MTAQHVNDVKHIGDAISITTLLGALVDVLPNIAVILTIIWTIIRIYETDTVQNILRKKKQKGKDK